MSKNILSGTFILILSLMVVSGCKTTEGLKVRGYVEDKERVDQKMDGNAGYLSGTPIPEDRSAYKESRRIYVLEVTKEADKASVDEMNINLDEPRSKEVPEDNFSSSSYPITQRKTNPVQARRIQIPSLDDVELNEVNKATIIEYVDYTVEKDDTLQKIAKKFYDSYSNWTKIYEVNKSIIKDPNFLKPGIVIKIPIEK